MSLLSGIGLKQVCTVKCDKTKTRRAASVIQRHSNGGISAEHLNHLNRKDESGEAAERVTGCRLGWLRLIDTQHCVTGTVDVLYVSAASITAVGSHFCVWTDLQMFKIKR